MRAAGLTCVPRRATEALLGHHGGRGERLSAPKSKEMLVGDKIPVPPLEAARAPAGVPGSLSARPASNWVATDLGPQHEPRLCKPPAGVTDHTVAPPSGVCRGTRWSQRQHDFRGRWVRGQGAGRTSFLAVAGSGAPGRGEGSGVRAPSSSSPASPGPWAAQPCTRAAPRESHPAAHSPASPPSYRCGNYSLEHLDGLSGVTGEPV